MVGDQRASLRAYRSIGLWSYRGESMRVCLEDMEHICNGVRILMRAVTGGDDVFGLRMHAVSKFDIRAFGSS